MIAKSKTQENIRKAKALWDVRRSRKMELVKEQLERTANRTEAQIEAQKVRKLAQKIRKKKLAIKIV